MKAWLLATGQRCGSFFYKENRHCHCLQQMCRAEKVKVKDGSTTNLHNHLKHKHEVAVEKHMSKKSISDQVSCCSSNQSTLTTAWTKLSKHSSQHKDISTAIANYIVLDLRPLNSCNDSGLIQCVKTLEPSLPGL